MFDLRQFASNVGRKISNAWNGKNNQNQQISSGIKGNLDTASKNLGSMVQNSYQISKPVVKGAIQSMSSKVANTFKEKIPVVGSAVASTISDGTQNLRGLVTEYKQNNLAQKNIDQALKQRDWNKINTGQIQAQAKQKKLQEAQTMKALIEKSGSQSTDWNEWNRRYGDVLPWGPSSPTTTPTPKIATSVVNTATPTSTIKLDTTNITTKTLGKNPNIKALANSFAGVGKYIENAAGKYGVDPHLMSDIAYQESKFNPSLKASEHGFDGITINPKTGKPYPYSSAAGLFQFTDGTWSEVMRRMGVQGDKMNPELNALAAAFLIAQGELSRWDASKNVWGSFYNEDELVNYDKRIAKKKTANKK